MDKLDPEERHKIADLQREKGNAAAGIGWMYKGDKPDSEEYLLGKRIDKYIDGDSEKKDEASVIFGERIKANIALDVAAKMREDPLFAIRRKEEESRKKLLENPIKMKELQKLIEQQQKLKEKRAKKAKKKKKKHKKSENSDDSDDNLMKKYLSILTSKQSKDRSDHQKNTKCRKAVSSDNESGVDDLSQHRDRETFREVKRSQETNGKFRSNAQFRDRVKAQGRSSSPDEQQHGRDRDVRHRHQQKDMQKDARNKSPEGDGFVNSRRGRDINVYSDREGKSSRDKRVGSDGRGNRVDYRDGDKDSSQDRSMRNNHKDRDYMKRKDLDSREKRKSKYSSDDCDSDDYKMTSKRRRSPEDRNEKTEHRNESRDKRKRVDSEERSSKTKNITQRISSNMKGRNNEAQAQRGKSGSRRSQSSDSESSDVDGTKDTKRTSGTQKKHKGKKRHGSSSSSSSSSEGSDHKGSEQVSTGTWEPRQYGLIVSSSNPTVSKPRQRSSSHSSSSSSSPSSQTPVSRITAAVRTKQAQRPPSPPRRKLTEEEKQKRLAEMTQNAEWREEQRERNVKKYREEEQEREKRDKDRQRGGGFLSSMMVDHASSSSVQDRLNRNKYNIQRTKADLDKNFTKK